MNVYPVKKKVENVLNVKMDFMVMTVKKNVQKIAKLIFVIKKVDIVNVN